MRRIIVLAAVAAAFAGISAPAANAYLVNGCQSGDWTAANVVVAGREVAQVCTSENPVTTISKLICLPCFVDGK